MKKRKPSEFARIYGSKERIAFVGGLMCLVDNILCYRGMTTRRHFSENAHIENGGMGRKADADKIVPLCPIHHRELHRGEQTFAEKYGIDLQAAAAETESAWLKHKSERAAA